MKNYYKLLLTSIIIIPIVSIFSTSIVIGEETTLLFRVNVSSLGLQASSSFAKDKNPDDIVEVSLPGNLYNPPIEITEINNDAINRNMPEGAEASFYSANRKGDAEWIINNWAQEDQKEIQNLIDEFLQQNTKISQNINKSYITGKAEYKHYTMLIIQNKFSDGRESRIIHTYIKTKEGWKATNAISDDETYDVVFSALFSGNIIKK